MGIKERGPPQNSDLALGPQHSCQKHLQLGMPHDNRPVKGVFMVGLRLGLMQHLQELACSRSHGRLRKALQVIHRITHGAPASQDNMHKPDET